MDTSIDSGDTLLVPSVLDGMEWVGLGSLYDTNVDTNVGIFMV